MNHLFLNTTDVNFTFFYFCYELLMHIYHEWSFHPLRHTQKAAVCDCLNCMMLSSRVSFITLPFD